MRGTREPGTRQPGQSRRRQFRVGKARTVKRDLLDLGFQGQREGEQMVMAREMALDLSRIWV